MVALLKNDIEMQRNKNWGFADHCKVLTEKTCSNGIKVCVMISVTMSYFTKGGKARLKPAYTYNVYDEHGWLYRSTSKTSAMKFYKLLK